MSVFHVLRDGSTPKDITGHVVKVSDADPLYRYIHSLNQGKSKTARKGNSWRVK